MQLGGGGGVTGVGGGGGGGAVGHHGSALEIERRGRNAVDEIGGDGTEHRRDQLADEIEQPEQRRR